MDQSCHITLCYLVRELVSKTTHIIMSHVTSESVTSRVDPSCRIVSPYSWVGPGNDSYYNESCHVCMSHVSLCAWGIPISTLEKKWEISHVWISDVTYESIILYTLNFVLMILLRIRPWNGWVVSHMIVSWHVYVYVSQILQIIHSI